MSPKNRAAVELGRRGGNATAKNLTPEQRKESARKAAQARWKYKKEMSELTRGLKTSATKLLKKNEAALARLAKKKDNA